MVQHIEIRIFARYNCDPREGSGQDRLPAHTPSFKHRLTESELDFSKMPAASRQFCHCYRKDMNHEVRESENPRHLHSTGIAAGTSDHIRNHDGYQSGHKDVISHLLPPGMWGLCLGPDGIWPANSSALSAALVCRYHDHLSGRYPSES